MILAVLCVPSLIFGVIFLLTDQYWAYLLFDIGALAELIFAFASLLRAKIKKPVAAVGVVWGIVLIFFTAVAIDPDVVIKPGQKMYGAYNSYEPHAETKTVVLDSGVTYTNDIAYDSDLPNSYFDVYLSPYGNEKSPTLILCHGGGYVWGDKVGGDPNAKDSGQDWYLSAYLNEGYNVVCPNYAFASEYPYPASLLQLNDFLDFLTEHGKEYGLCMGCKSSPRFKRPAILYQTEGITHCVVSFLYIEKALYFVGSTVFFFLFSPRSKPESAGCPIWQADRENLRILLRGCHGNGQAAKTLIECHSLVIFN